MKWSTLHVFLVVLTVSAKFLIPEKQINKSLVSAVVQVIQNILAQKYGTVNVITAVEDSNSGFADSVLSEILNQTNAKALFRLNNHKKISTIKSRFRKFNVIILDSIASYRTFDDKINSSLFLSYGYFLFVLIDGKRIEHNEILTTLWAKNIYNVNFIYGNGEVETFMPFSENAKCGDTKPVLINSFVNETFTNGLDFVFPDKFKNLHNCPVKFVTFNDTFAVSCKKRSDGSCKLVGYDVELMEALASSINFNTRLKFLEGHDPWGNFPIK